MKITPDKIKFITEENLEQYEELLCPKCKKEFQINDAIVTKGNKAVKLVLHIDCLGNLGNRNFVQDVDEDGRC